MQAAAVVRRPRARSGSSAGSRSNAQPDDHIDASLLKADGIQLTENGGLGADATLGSQGDDLISGGDGDDTALLREGDDTFVWSPADDNDTLEGQAGFDTMRFNGANIADKIDLSADGGGVRFTRDIATVTMDLDDVEGVDFNALGGADNVLVHDLSGTDLTEVNTNLATATGAGDAAPDNLIGEGTEADDVSVIAGDGSGVAVLGLAARVNITGAEAANDRLRVNTRASDDVVDATSLAAGSIQLTADGGDDDVLLGGAGDDVLLGGAGDDVLIGGPGTDTIDGGPKQHRHSEPRPRHGERSRHRRDGAAEEPRPHRRRQDRARRARQGAHTAARRLAHVGSRSGHGLSRLGR